MVTIKSDKLVIEIKHSAPDELHKILKESIIEVLQNQMPETGDPQRQYLINYNLLELLKNMELKKRI